jgi:hypothetical protein
MMRGQCPKCGRFCSKIKGFGNDFHGLVKVTGICNRHKTVDLSNQDYEYDDFWEE